MKRFGMVFLCLAMVFVLVFTGCTGKKDEDVTKESEKTETTKATQTEQSESCYTPVSLT